MKKAATILFLVGMWTSPTRAQQHAPTVDVCRADAALWYSTEAATEYIKAENEHLSNGTRNRTPIAKLGVEEIVARSLEMGDCASVDSDRFNTYHDAQKFYMDVVHDRMASFIYRHHLMEQLKREDARGLR